MDNKLLLGKVEIVEWLRSGDDKTGWTLFNEIEPIGIMSKPPVEIGFHRISLRSELIALLRTFEDDFRATGRPPILHIETHGNEDGIGISADEGFLWPEFMEELIPLNRLTRLNLVVVLAACEGIWGVQMLQPARGAASFRGLIGPNRVTSADELEKGCLAFYRTVFSEWNGDAAFKAMNNAINPLQPTFNMWSAWLAFKLSYQQYLKKHCSPEEVARRADAVATQWAARVKTERGVGVWAHEMDKMRAMLRQRLDEHAERFEEMRRDFFFIDLYPENDQRFALTIEECWPT